MKNTFSEKGEKDKKVTKGTENYELERSDSEAVQS